MRVARQHPYLPVPSRTTTTTTTNNGKLVVLFNSNQDVVHQQLPSQSPPQSPPQVLQQPQQQHQPTGDENSAVVPPSCVFPSCESAPTDLQGGPTILMDRFLLLGPAEGSALYRCVDVHSGQKLVAKVSIFICFSYATRMIYAICRTLFSPICICILFLVDL